MDKGAKGALWFSIAVMVGLVIILFLYFVLFEPRDNIAYTGQAVSNPASGLTEEQAIAAFDESFVYSFLVSIKAYNLHNPPLSSDKPRIQIEVEDETFNTVIDSGEIIVGKGNIAGEDVLIRTTRLEIVKIINDKTYARGSFNEGKSEIVFVAGKTLLFSKGYLNLYKQITGSSITGNIIRMTFG
jgi:hypothetical protein